ncbi:hypothetical protein AVBRAN12642_07425 [Campylobacter sp. RM12642]|uniref:hypothetical protein n=1 Tax=unclassified Campylobacter TaxID=2593542 RepID=UPI003015600C|nr:hypothetical protein [Campylobacter sp. RM12654]MBZ7980461.1 hypothetical protein [Campylobacter sp. RM12642]
MKKINLVAAGIVCLFSTGCVLPKLPPVPDALKAPEINNNNSKSDITKRPMILMEYPDGRIETQGNMNYGKKCVLEKDSRSGRITKTGIVIRDRCVPDYCKKWYDDVDLQPKNEKEDEELRFCEIKVKSANFGYKLIK